MYADQKYKCCTKCLIEKPFDEFYFNNQRQLYYPNCKDCIRKKSSKYFKDNQERLTKTHRDYQRIYRKHNRAKERDWAKKWRTTNPDRRRWLNRQSYKRTQKKRLANSRLYFARKLKASPKWLTSEHRRMIETIYEICPQDWHVDHIIPLKGKNVCGLHVPWNLQHLSAKENMIKSNHVEAAEVEDKKPLR